MTATAPPPARPPRTKRTASPEVPCAHCGLPVGRRPAWTQAAEPCCCTGCAVVRDALATSGLGETYDRLRDLAPSRSPQRAQSPEALVLAELDRPEFIEQSTQPAEGGRSVNLFLDGVHCAACVWLVERLPYEMEGVSGARLDLPRARLELTFDPEHVRLSDVGRWLARFGYAARPSRPDAGTASAAERSLLIRMGVAWALAGNIMLVAFALYSGLDEDPTAPLASAARWFSLALMIPAVTYGAAPFFRRAGASLRSAWQARSLRHLHLDTPISLGILVGVGQSAWATVMGQGEVWFDSVAVLIAALLTARWIQLRSRRLAGEASDRLLALVPRVARRVDADGVVSVVDVDDLQPDDLIEVPTGEVLPVDGVVEVGESRLDRAALTGEARPEPVSVGSAVEAGTTNLQTPLRIRTRAVGEQTRVGRLLAWVEKGDVKRAPVVLWADRVGGVFVLTVLALAAFTATLWLWLDPAQMPAHVAALLVITCPCALGMATPLALAVASGRAARSGIFVKSDEAVQQLTRIDTVVLDKTGTLTEGRMAVASSTGELADLERVAALEEHVTHPVAEAIVQAFGADIGPVSCVEAEAGAGVRGLVDSRAVVVGRPDWVAAQTALPMPSEVASSLQDVTARGLTPVVALVDQRWAAVLGIGDRLRPEAGTLVRQLEADGATVHILSGDHPAAVAHVASALGIDAGHAHGGISPEAKREAVEALQAGGGTVLMVGDGVNDAAALRQADVGAAVGGGTTAALVAADLFLTRRGIAPLRDALGGARSAMRTVRVLLAISLGYNVLGAAAAVAGLVTPLVAAAAMPVSSLLVVGLALLQPSFRRSP